MAPAEDIYRKTGTCVTCPTCSFEISVLNTKQLPREFSVLCPNCRGRKSYQVAQVHDQKPEAETTRGSAKIQFGTKEAIDSDLPVETPMQPKSLLNELAHWLLK